MDAPACLLDEAGHPTGKNGTDHVKHVAVNGCIGCSHPVAPKQVIGVASLEEVYPKVLEFVIQFIPPVVPKGGMSLKLFLLASLVHPHLQHFHACTFVDGNEGNGPCLVVPFEGVHEATTTSAHYGVLGGIWPRAEEVVASQYHVRLDCGSRTAVVNGNNGLYVNDTIPLKGTRTHQGWPNVHVKSRAIEPCRKGEHNVQPRIAVLCGGTSRALCSFFP